MSRQLAVADKALSFCPLICHDSEHALVFGFASNARERSLVLPFFSDRWSIADKGVNRLLRIGVFLPLGERKLRSWAGEEGFYI